VGEIRVGISQARHVLILDRAERRVFAMLEEQHRTLELIIQVRVRQNVALLCLCGELRRGSFMVQLERNAREPLKGRYDVSYIALHRCSSVLDRRTRASISVDLTATGVHHNDYLLSVAGEGFDTQKSSARGRFWILSRAVTTARSIRYIDLKNL
jgi:hypothetical protein